MKQFSTAEGLILASLIGAAAIIYHANTQPHYSPLRNGAIRADVRTGQMCFTKFAYEDPEAMQFLAACDDSTAALLKRKP